jgi:NADPH:quinone reductase
MRAAWYEKVGPAREVLEVGEMPDPEPGRGEVRVRIHASGVNPSDTKRRSGATEGMTFPRIIPHSDGAGVIDRVGPGIEETRVGERVWTYNARWQRPFGTAAEYVVLPSQQAVHLPDSASFAEGACLAIPGMTAHRCVFIDGPVRGKTVLVTGGAGSVGHYAVQLAKWGGATVIATVSSEKKAAHAAAAGADHTIDYQKEDVAKRVKELTGGEGVDRIVEVDFGKNLPVSLAIIKNGGAIAAYSSTGNPEPKLAFSAFMRLNTTIRLVLVYSMPAEAKAQACSDIVRLLEEHTLINAIAKRCPLQEIAAAHEAVESGAYMGKIAIDLAGR